MRLVLVSLVLASTLCACEQTDGGAARSAAGAAIEPSTEKEGAGTSSSDEARRATGQAIKKVELYPRDKPPSAAAARDASSGIPTGKR